MKIYITNILTSSKLLKNKNSAAVFQSLSLFKKPVEATHKEDREALFRN